MAVVQTLIGNVKGPQGDTGATGAQGAQGDAATISVGSVTTAAYGTAASVTNSGTSGAAVFDFVIPQGAPGETVTDMQNLTLGSITASSASFPTPTVGETGKVIFGKINKWFSDMAALVATKFNTANVVNNLTTTSSGYALDARQGKLLGNRTVAVHTSSPTVNAASGVTVHSCVYTKVGALMFVTVQFSVTTAVVHNASIFSISGCGHPLYDNVPISVLGDNSSNISHIRPVATGTYSMTFTSNGTTPVGSYYNGTVIAFVDPEQ